MLAGPVHRALVLLPTSYDLGSVPQPGRWLQPGREEARAHWVGGLSRRTLKPRGLLQSTHPPELVPLSGLGAGSLKQVNWLLALWPGLPCLKGERPLQTVSGKEPVAGESGLIS